MAFTSVRESRHLSIFTWIACVGIILLGGVARAAQPGIADEAKFFKPATVEQSTEVIRQIKREFGKDVIIETYPAIPEDLRAEFKAKGKDQFYAEWNSRRFKETGTDGVLILITRDPGRLQIGTNRATEARLFTIADREALRNHLTERFRAKEYDDGLLRTVQFVLKRMEKNAGANFIPPPAAASQPAVIPSTVPATGATPQPLAASQPAVIPLPAPATTPTTQPTATTRPTTRPATGSTEGA